MPLPTSAFVSSTGNYEKYFHRSYGGSLRVEVEDFKTGIDEVGLMELFTIYTFRDQLRLVYNFNDAFVEPFKRILMRS